MKSTNKLISQGKVVKKKSLTRARTISVEKITNEDLKNYIDFLRLDYQSSFALNDFITQDRKCDENHLLVADLSNLVIGKANSSNLFDLKGANFIGSIFYETRFTQCDLEGVKFCNTNLERVVFKDSNLNFVDFRGADLGSCRFSENYNDPPWNAIEGLKFSSTASCLRVFADVKNSLAKRNELQRLLLNKKLELAELRNKTSLLSRIGLILHLSEGCIEYRRVRSEYVKMKKGIFHTDHLIHTSFQNIFYPESFIFEPVMLSGENFFPDKKLNKKLVRLNRNNVIDFLKKCKKSKTFSLNDYAKKLYIQSQPNDFVLESNTKYIADISSKVNLYGNNEWNRINLSGLDFTGINISEANFSGSNLSKCIFTDADISNSNFECALLEYTIFNNTNADESNFYGSDFSRSSIVNSNFKKAKLDWSIANHSAFENVNLDFVSVKNASWHHVRVTKCKMNNADFSKVEFRNSRFKEITAKHSIFNKSNFSKSQFTSCDFKESLFNLVNAKHSIWYNTIATKIEARYSNYTGSKFSEKCKFKKADFSHSILDGIKSPRGCFIGAKMNYVKIGFGKFADSCFDDASLRFAELSNCVFTESSCKKTDFTGAKLVNVRMIKSDLSKSIYNGSELKDSDFTRADFSDAIWKNTYIKDSILEGVNNHRIKINDNTEIIDCKFKDLAGQFYHYDEDNFMDIMFIEQLKLNMEKIMIADKLKTWGMFSFILKMAGSGYSMTRKEVNLLHNYRLRNKKELMKYIRKLKAEEYHGVDLNVFISNNFLARKEGNK
jgi:uncharacterized protein YjbI with pentapeptide repeats